MKYRRFGRTELQMPVFTCGGMRYQHKWNDVPWEEIPEEGQKNLEATILRALDLGINHIETARGYGSSEMQLGRILPTLPREKMIVQTKVSPTADPAEFEKNFERSMEYLKLDYVDLLSIHGINNDETLEWAIRKGGCLEKAHQIVKQGRARFVGFSTHGTCRAILEAIETGGFDYVNLHWYFVNDFNWPAVQAAAARDMGVFIISPNDKGGMLYHPTPVMKELCAPLSPMQFNNLYCLARPEVHTLSIGAARPSDFDEHIASLEWYEQAQQIVPPIEARLRTRMDEILGVDWCKGWWNGIPEYTETPNHINLLEILRLWSFSKSLGLVEWGKMRYNLLGNAGHWFPGMPAAEFDPAQIRSFLNGHPFADKIPTILREAHELLVAEKQKRLSESD